MLSGNGKLLTAKESYGTVDDLVQYISLHKPNHILLNGSILPFMFLYLIWLYVWIFIYGIENYNEFLFISILVIAIIHIFICLCCFWSVHIHTFLNCRKVRIYSFIIKTQINLKDSNYKNIIIGYRTTTYILYMYNMLSWHNVDIPFCID